MRENYTITSVDPKDYNKQFLKKLPESYSNSINHVIIMGKNPESVKVEFSKTVVSKLTIDSPVFNYSLGVNIILRSLANQLTEDRAVLVTDGKTAVSMTQVLGYEFNKINLNENFIVINTLVDNSGRPLNLNVSSPMLSVMKRIKTLSDTASKYIPSVITTVDILTNIVNGLEENLFTTYSRIQLIKSLEHHGLKRQTSKHFGCFLGKDPSPNIIEKEDLNLIKKMKDSHQNNKDIEWGSVNRIFKANFFHGGLPKWKKEDKRELPPKEEKRLLIEDIIVNSDEVKIEKKPKEKRIVSPLTKIKGKKSLILVNNNLKYLISITPLIKYLYKNTGEKVDIMTNDKLATTVPLIESEMVDKIFDISNMLNKLIPFNKYNMIIRSVHCRIKVPDNLNIMNCSPDPKELRAYADLNCSIFENLPNFSHPLPYCSQRGIGNRIFSEPVSIGISTDKLGTYYWEGLTVLAGRLANRGNNIYVIGLDKEHIPFNVDNLKCRQRIVFEGKLDYKRAAGFINSSSIFITHPQTELSWLGYGLNQNMILIGNTTTEIPELDWIRGIEVNDKTSIDNVEDIINNFVEYIRET